MVFATRANTTCRFTLGGLVFSCVLFMWSRPSAHLSISQTPTALVIGETCCGSAWSMPQSLPVGQWQGSRRRRHHNPTPPARGNDRGAMRMGSVAQQAAVHLFRLFGR